MNCCSYFAHQFNAALGIRFSDTILYWWVLRQIIISLMSNSMTTIRKSSEFDFKIIFIDRSTNRNFMKDILKADNL